MSIRVDFDFYEIFSDLVDFVYNHPKIAVSTASCVSSAIGLAVYHRRIIESVQQGFESVRRFFSLTKLPVSQVTGLFAVAGGVQAIRGGNLLIGIPATVAGLVLAYFSRGEVQWPPARQEPGNIPESRSLHIDFPYRMTVDIPNNRACTFQSIGAAMKGLQIDSAFFNNAETTWSAKDMRRYAGQTPDRMLLLQYRDVNEGPYHNLVLQNLSGLLAIKYGFSYDTHGNFSPLASLNESQLAVRADLKNFQGTIRHPDIIRLDHEDRPMNDHNGQPIVEIRGPVISEILTRLRDRIPNPT